MKEWKTQKLLREYMDKKRLWKCAIGRQGFTLVEVLVAFMILMMASQILLLGIVFVAKIEERAENIEIERRSIGEYLADKSECSSGTILLEMGDLCEDIVCDGWLYAGSGENELASDMDIIWVEMDVLPEPEDGD